MWSATETQRLPNRVGQRFSMISAEITSEATRAVRRALWLCCIAAWSCLLTLGNAEAGFIQSRLVDPDPSLLVVAGTPVQTDSGWAEQGAGSLPTLPSDEVPADDPEEEGVDDASGMAAGSNSQDSGPSSVPAAACLTSTELPVPTLTAWLHHGQFLAVPPAPRSGQCRPP